MVQKFSTLKGEIVLLLTLFALGWFYGYGDSMFYMPQSTDIWRQSDCASFALNYFQDGMNFFKPHVHHCLNPKADGCAAGEFPLIYYAVAILYKLFGVNVFLFRLTNTIIFVFGLLALYKIVYHFLNDRFYAFILPVLLFSCPIIAFYANNFLSDVSSLSFTFMAWYQALKYKKDQRRINFILSMLFFTIAMLLKANSAISFFTLGCIFFIELNNWNTFNSGKKIFNSVALNIAGFATAAVIAMAWYKWAIAYNSEHQTIFLGTQSWPGWPIWEVSDANYVSTLTSMFFNANSLFNIFTTAIFLFALVFVIANRSVLTDFMFGIYLLLLTGSLLFLLYFFVGFRNQAYYYINLMPFPVFTFIMALYIVKVKYENVYQSLIFKLMVLGILILNIQHTSFELTNSFYNGGWRHSQLSSTLYEDEFRAFLDSKVPQEEKVISIPDGTPNSSLYVLNRKGWSNYGFPSSTVDSVTMVDFINKGAAYLITTEETEADAKVLQPFKKKEVGTYKNVRIYSLK